MRDQRRVAVGRDGTSAGVLHDSRLEIQPHHDHPTRCRALEVSISNHSRDSILIFVTNKRHLSHCKSLPGWKCLFQGVGGCSYEDTLIPSLVLEGRDMTPLPAWSLETEEEGSAPQVVQLETLNFSIPARHRLRNAEYFASSRSTLKDRHPFFIPNKLLEPLVNVSNMLRRPPPQPPHLN